MVKGMKLGILAFAVVFMGIYACDQSSSDDASTRKQMPTEETGEKKTEEGDIPDTGTLAPPNSKGEKFDPKKDKKQQPESTSASLPKSAIAFDEYDWDFGDINEGDQVEHTFTFTNEGSEPLILEKCKGSCGCTVPTCPAEPIPPGGTGEILVKFNSTNKKNVVSKMVNITANTEPLITKLTITANVAPKDGNEG
jgi:hypothetical protein